MTPAVTMTLDVEDLRPSADLPERVVAMTHLVLDLFAEHGVRASVFVVGDLAERRPDLVRRAAAEGHEIGLHAHTHVPLPTLDPDVFVSLTGDARARLQDLSQQSVDGFRAPMMSLVPASAWVVPLLSDLGFAYSSSVLPGPSPLYGWPGLPRRVFRWADGPIEFPCPLVRVPGLYIPYLGGTYLRLLPDAVRRFGLRRANSDEALWAYCHPWEFDPDEPYHPHDFIGGLASRVAWLRRSRMVRRVRRVLDEPVAPTLGELADDLDRSRLPVVDPSAPQSLGAVARWANGRLRQR